MTGANVLIEQQLSRAKSAVRAGDATTAAHNAKAALVRAVDARDRHLQARACLALAEALMLESRMRWARHYASLAHALFREMGDAMRCMEALPVISYALSALGEDDAARRTAREIVGLAVDMRWDLGMAVGMNSQGVAALWDSDFGTTRAVLDAARDFAAKSSGTPRAAFQPLTNACFAEVLRVRQAARAGAACDAARLEQLVASGWQLVGDGAADSLTGANTRPGLLLLEFASAFLAARRRHADEAVAYERACVRRAGQLPSTHWMRALPCWARMERALAADDPGLALAAASAMQRMADAGEHEHLKRLAAGLAHEVRDALSEGSRPAGLSSA